MTTLCCATYAILIISSCYCRVSFTTSIWSTYVNHLQMHYETYAHMQRDIETEHRQNMLLHLQGNSFEVFVCMEYCCSTMFEHLFSWALHRCSIFMFIFISSFGFSICMFSIESLFFSPHIFAFSHCMQLKIITQFGCFGYTKHRIFSCTLVISNVSSPHRHSTMLYIHKTI